MQPDFLGTILKSILVKTWPLLILAAVIYIVAELGPVFFAQWKRRNKFNSGEKWRSGRDLVKWLQGLTPSEFEDYIAHLFKNLGYSVEVTGAAYDGGIDVIAEKNGIKHYIQCKKFITSQVPVGAIRDFYGAMADRGAQAKGFFITTNKFTLEAERFAEDKPIELVDGLKLAKYIEMAKIGTGAATTTSEVKTCPICKSPMVKRQGKFGEFYGCSRYPECKGTLKI